MSAAFTTAFAPKVGQDVDALGIGGGSYTSSEDDEENDFDAADLFSIEVEDEGGEMTEMFAGEGLTSMILREDEHGNSQDWASELLLLTDCKQAPSRHVHGTILALSRHDLAQSGRVLGAISARHVSP